MKLREWATSAELSEDDEKALELLRLIDHYRGPGWVRQSGETLDPYGDMSNFLLDLGLIEARTEPLGTFTDGREDYGTVWHVTSLGIDELGVWE